MIGVVAAAAQSVTTNPNTGDAWLGRLETVLTILVAAAVLIRPQINRFHQANTQMVRREAKNAVKKEMKRMRRELRVHTDAEGALVRSEVERAVEPITRELTRQGKRFEELDAERSLALRQNNAEHLELHNELNRVRTGEPAR